MAVYRNVHLSFWTDNKVEDDFTPEDKYFYLYLLTNPQTNICGCYEVSYNQMTQQTGYNKDTINRLLDRFENVYRMIRFDSETKEILILNWFKYNWGKSPRVISGVESVAKTIKSERFKKFVYKVIESVINGSLDSLNIQYIYSMVTSDTDTVSNNNIVSNYPSVDTKEDIKESNSSKNDVDFEELWDYTFKNYKKHNASALAKQAWMNKIIITPEENRFDVAKLIYKAMMAYLANHIEENPHDKDYRFIPKFDKWLTEDCDYWISVVEKGERE